MQGRLPPKWLHDSPQLLLSAEYSGKPFGSRGYQPKCRWGAHNTSQDMGGVTEVCGYNVPHFWSLWGPHRLQKWGTLYPTHLREGAVTDWGQALQ